MERQDLQGGCPFLAEEGPVDSPREVRNGARRGTWERVHRSDSKLAAQMGEVLAEGPKSTDLFSHLYLISGRKGPHSRAWRTQKEAQAGSEFWVGHTGKLFSLRVSFLVWERGM